jgi:uncharacterized protein (TIGR00369 family)
MAISVYGSGVSLMTHDQKNLDEMLDLLKSLFEDGIPFNKVLGLKIESIKKDNIRLKFEMRDELIGNTLKKILHGGVISSVLDVTGGIISMADVIGKMTGRPRDEIAKRLFNVGTIDLRIDYLRPGNGKYFIATGSIMRTGMKVAVVRTQLHNDKDVLIAAGTGTYIIG